MLKIAGLLLFLLMATNARAVTEEELLEAAKRDPVMNLSTNMLRYGDVLLAEFQKRYPFVKVSRNRYPATDARFYFYGLFTGERENLRADVIFRCQDRDIQDWKASGWLADLSDLPNWQKRQGDLEDDSKYLYFVAAPHVIFYHPKVIKEADLPKSLEELTQPAWKGKISMRNPTAGSSGAFLTHYIEGTRGNLEWYAKMGENKAFVGHTGFSVHEAVQNKKSVIGISRDVEVLGFAGDLLERKKKKSVLKYKILEGDLPYQFQLAMMNAHGPHPASARLFLNWALSDEARAHLEKAGYSVNERRASQQSHPHIWKWKIADSADPVAYEAKLAKAVRLLKQGGARMEKKGTGVRHASEH